MTDHVESNPTPIVLVHGGWCGGWVWDRVAPRLAGAGHEVCTPTLIGLGDRAAEGSADTDVSDQVADLIATVEAIGRPVALLGHSYAGVVVVLLADRRPDVVEHLIVLDGFVPGPGDRLLDLVDPGDAEATRAEQAANSGYRPPPDPGRWGIADPELRRLLADRLTPQPGGTSQETLKIRNSFDGRRTYVSMTRNQKAHFVRTADRLATDPAWDLLPYDGPHFDMLIEPAALAGHLLEVVGRRDHGRLG